MGKLMTRYAQMIFLGLAAAVALAAQSAGVTEVTVAYSATPTFTANAASTNFSITLTGNVTSSTFASPAVGVGSFKICQDATGGRTFAWPSNAVGFGTIDATANKCSRQAWKWDGTTLQATGAMMTDGSAPGGIPGLGTAATHAAGDFQPAIAGAPGTWPSSFPPSAHASTHGSGGSDPVALAESQVTNLSTDLASKDTVTAVSSLPTAATATVGRIYRWTGAAASNSCPASGAAGSGGTHTAYCVTLDGTSWRALIGAGTDGSVAMGTTCPAGAPTGSICLAGNPYSVSRAAQTLPNNTVVICCDSITQLNGLYPFPGGTRPSFGPTIRGYWDWAMALSGQRMRLVHNAGINGNQTSDMLARIQADVIAYHPAYCFVLAGVNDTDHDVTAATTIANLTTIYTTLLKNNIRVIAATITPTDYSLQSSPASYSAAWATVNAWIRQYVPQQDGMYLVDFAGVIADGTSTYPKDYAAYVEDGTHPSSAGAYQLGSALAAVINTIVPPSNTGLTWNADTNNLFAGGLFLGTGGTTSGGASGTVATGWTLQRVSSTSTCVGSQSARSDGLGNYQIVTASGSASMTDTCSLHQTISGWTTGTNLVIRVEMDATSTIDGIYVRITLRDNTFTDIQYAVGMYTDPTAKTLGLTPAHAVFQSYPIPLPSNTFVVFADIGFRGNGAAKFSRAEVLVR